MKQWIFNMIALMAGAAAVCFGQSDYLPFKDSTLIYANSTDTLVYRFTPDENPGICYLRVTDKRNGTVRDSRIIVRDNMLYESYTDGLKLRLFSLQPDKGERYTDQDITTEVISVNGKLKIGKKSYKQVICVKRVEFGSFVTHYYFAKGIGLIRREEPDKPPLDLITE